MKKFIHILLLFSATTTILNSKTLSVHKAAGAVVLDGAGDEDAWTAPAWNDMDQNKGEAANKNNTAKFKMTYNCDFVYVYAEVLDAKIDTSQSKNVWEKDCIEVFFSLDTTTQKTATNGQNAFWQSRKVFGRDMTDNKNKGFKAEEQDIAGGKSQEWQLAWDSIASTIKDKQKWDHRNFRFEIQNGDNDGSGRNSQLFWNSNADDQWNSIVHQGYVVLEGEHPENGGIVCFTGLVDKKLSESFIKMYSDHIEFSESCNFYIYNSEGSLIYQGYKCKSFSTGNLKKGFYIVKAHNSFTKFVK